MSNVSSLERPVLREPELGIDEGVARILRQKILDVSVELPSSGRNSAGEWATRTPEDMVEYASWLCKLLEIDPLDKSGPKLTQKLLNRASKLGLGPSAILFTDKYTPGMRGITQLNQELGADTQYAFRDWTMDTAIVQGRKLFRHKPNYKKIRQLRQQGRFPGETWLISRFKTLANFSEHVGFIEATGMQEEDYVDLAVAIKRQNRPNTKISIDVVKYLYNKGRSPGANTITHNVGYDRLNRLATAQYEEEKESEKIYLERQKSVAYNLLESNSSFRRYAKEIESGSDLVRHAAQYRLVERVLPGLKIDEQTRLSYRRNPNLVVIGIVEAYPNISAGEIENEAVLLDVFDILWPSYRFQNVNLRLPEFLQ